MAVVVRRGRGEQLYENWWMCPLCGGLHDTRVHANRCDHQPMTDYIKPSVGETVSLQHRSGERRGLAPWIRYLIVAVVCVAWVLLAVLIGTQWASAAPAPLGPICTPSTYPVPCPSVGVVC